MGPKDLIGRLRTSGMGSANWSDAESYRPGWTIAYSGLVMTDDRAGPDGLADRGGRPGEPSGSALEGTEHCFQRTHCSDLFGREAMSGYRADAIHCIHCGPIVKKGRRDNAAPDRGRKMRAVLSVVGRPSLIRL